MSILLVDDTFIATLNEKYLQRVGPTNVISFPMREGEFADLNPEILGDVVISVETAQREAKEFKQEFEYRLHYLLIHGILHLIGYDHEKSEVEQIRMDNESDRLMGLIYKHNEFT